MLRMSTRNPSVRLIVNCSTIVTQSLFESSVILKKKKTLLHIYIFKWEENPGRVEKILKVMYWL